MADQVLYSGVACITDLMVKEGLINLDFADVRSVMREMGKAMMGTGEASGERRAIQAAEAAIANPLLDETSMKGAKGLLISITGGKDLTLFEVDEAATRIREEVDPDANIILGATFEESAGRRHPRVGGGDRHRPARGRRRPRRAWPNSPSSGRRAQQPAPPRSCGGAGGAPTGPKPPRRQTAPRRVAQPTGATPARHDQPMQHAAPTRRSRPAIRRTIDAVDPAPHATASNRERPPRGGGARLPPRRRSSRRRRKRRRASRASRISRRSSSARSRRVSLARVPNMRTAAR